MPCICPLCAASVSLRAAQYRHIKDIAMETQRGIHLRELGRWLRVASQVRGCRADSSARLAVIARAVGRASLDADLVLLNKALVDLVEWVCDRRNGYWDAGRERMAAACATWVR